MDNTGMIKIRFAHTDKFLNVQEVAFKNIPKKEYQKWLFGNSYWTQEKYKANNNWIWLRNDGAVSETVDDWLLYFFMLMLAPTEIYRSNASILFFGVEKLFWGAILRAWNFFLPETIARLIWLVFCQSFGYWSTNRSESLHSCLASSELFNFLYFPTHPLLKNFSCYFMYL